MTRHFSLATEAIVSVADAVGCIPDIAEHLEGHGARVSSHGNATVLDFDFSRGVLEPQDGFLRLRAEAADPSLLHEIKMELAEHVEEFTGIAATAIVWRGDESDGAAPPNFRLMRVVETRRITPHMQRVRFAGENLLRYSGMGNLHCKLLIPPAGLEPQWPTLDAGGSFRWPAGPGKPSVRKYTIRAIDVERGTLDIDLVVHGDEGPGSAWALTARPGDAIGMVGPGGRGVAAADWHLLAGDETALPAIARVLESLPPLSRGVALIEVADGAEEQDLAVPEGFELRWLHRNGAAPGTTTLLADAVRSVPVPADAGTVFVWAGCEFAAFKTIRAYVRKELKLAKEQHLVTSYWRRGVSEDGASRLDAVSTVVSALGKRIGLPTGD
jgi:NADPH-dependent ferric siderophore reductase